MLLRLTPLETSQLIEITVTGDLFVNGSTTQINTNSISIEDRTIELGRVAGNAPFWNNYLGSWCIIQL